MPCSHNHRVTVEIHTWRGNPPENRPVIGRPPPQDLRACGVLAVSRQVAVAIGFPDFGDTCLFLQAPDSGQEWLTNMDVKASDITPDPNSLTFILNHMHETGFPGHAPGDHHTSFGGNGPGGADAVAGAVHAKIALPTLVKAALSLGCVAAISLTIPKRESCHW